MTAQHLLPSNATPIERAQSEALDRDAILGPPIDAIAAWRFERPLPVGFGPWLVNEYQLGTIRAYFATDEEAIDAGWPWLKLRGTVQAVEDALGWIDYTEASVEPPHVARRKWNRYQIAMGDLPASEDPDLYDAEFLASLSDPARSVFQRGHHGYDVRVKEWSRGRWGQTRWGSDSGARLPDGQTKWSHGRDHGVFEVSAPSTMLDALGLTTLAAGTVDWTSALTWAQVSDLTWGDPTAEQIALLVANVVQGLGKHVGFYDVLGNLIGARRAYSIVPATDFAGAPVPADQTVLEIKVRTGFGDGFGHSAATVALILGASSKRGPGDLWVTPDHLQAPDGIALTDITIGAAPLAIDFTRTIREFVTFKVRIL